jgi:hypothetical protein
MQQTLLKQPSTVKKPQARLREFAARARIVLGCIDIR